jgi:hypothetical protein
MTQSHSGTEAPIRAGGTGSPTAKALACHRKDHPAAEKLPVRKAPAGSCPPAGAAKGRFGAVKGQKPPRGRQVTVAEFRRMWFDAELTLDDIGRELGICSRSVWQRAKHRGMPPRPSIIKPGPAPTLDAEAEAMWRACVRVEDIAAAYGTSVSTVHMHVHRRGVKRDRTVSRWHPGISIDDYRQIKLGEAMAASARETEAAIDLAEMRDGFRRAA